MLGEYRDDMVIIGGWVPPLLLPDCTGHVGSMDVDVALNHLAEANGVYTRIAEALAASGYRQDEQQPFIWYRDVRLENGDLIVVEIDFLAGEYGGTGRRHRTQHVQDLQPRKARGADLLFDHAETRSIQARIPGGAKDTVSVRVAGVSPFIVMKASALDTRIKQKDAYDIWFVLANYPGGVEAVLGEFAPFGNHGLVLEAVEILKCKFESPEHIGPVAIAEFLDRSGEDAEILQRDAFERVQALTRGLEQMREI